MKKLGLLMLTLFLAAMLTLSVSAERTLPLVVDGADLLTSSEEYSLESKLNELSEKLKFEFAVVTVNSTNGLSAMAYADDFYDYNGYGYGDNDDGVLLLVDMGERTYHMTTHGKGKDILDYDTLGYVENDFYDALTDGDYYEAFAAFADSCAYYVKDATTINFAGYILPSLIVGFVISLIIVSVMKSGMKSVRFAANASSYMVKDSLKMTLQRDNYLYTTTSRTPRAQNTGGSGRSGGHVSSSGRSHGGRGGRF